MFNSCSFLLCTYMSVYTLYMAFWENLHIYVQPKISIKRLTSLLCLYIKAETAQADSLLNAASCFLCLRERKDGGWWTSFRNGKWKT